MLLRKWQERFLVMNIHIWVQTTLKDRLSPPCSARTDPYNYDMTSLKTCFKMFAMSNFFELGFSSEMLCHAKTEDLMSEELQALWLHFVFDSSTCIICPVKLARWLLIFLTRAANLFWLVRWFCLVIFLILRHVRGIILKVWPDQWIISIF